MATTGRTTGSSTAAPMRREELDQLLARLRRQQPLPEFAEQRHQFLDIDPDLEREDYTTPARIGGAR